MIYIMLQDWSFLSLTLQNGYIAIEFRTELEHRLEL